MAEQRPGGEPTEQPTAKKLADARKKGQVAKSRDLSAGFVFWAGLAVLLITLPTMSARLVALLRGCFTAAAHPSFAVLQARLDWGLSGALRSLLPLLGGVAGAAVLAGMAQTRGLFTFHPLKPKLEGLNPLKGVGRVLGKDALFRLLKTAALFATAFVLAYLTLRQYLPLLLRTLGSKPQGWAAVCLEVTQTLAIRLGFCFVAMGVADYAFQVHRRKKRLMMTRYEVERETKETEGDPQHKARRQEIHQEIANSAMLEAVEDADFVVCNPTRLAVAMRYCKAKHDAPVVVAKGQHLLAQKIKQRARRAGVPVLRDVSLARALWELQVDQEIPPALYEAVAAVLRVVAETEKEP